jgi:hypothetical protein
MADRYANMQDDGDAEAVDGVYSVFGLAALYTLACADRKAQPAVQSHE